MKKKDEQQESQDSANLYREVGRRLYAAVISCQLRVGLDYALKHYTPANLHPSWGELGWSLQRHLVESSPVAIAVRAALRDKKAEPKKQ